MSGYDHEPAIQRKSLLVLKVLILAVPGPDSDRRVSTHLDHSQEIEERGLCPGTGHSLSRLQTAISDTN